MKYKNIMTLNELKNLIPLDDYIIVNYNNDIITDYDTTEYRVGFISSTPMLIPTGDNAKYEAKSEYKPDKYKKTNLHSSKDYCIDSKLVIYVIKITNEVLEDGS